jgi:N-acyl homoserine lactone hydrolase
MRIHAFRTALMSVKRNYHSAKGANRAMRLTSSLLDTQWIQIPVFAWVIEHPEGVIVIDAGETAKVHDPNYFPLYQRPYWLSQYRFIIQPQDELGAQMQKAGIPPQDVRWLVLTHTHFDHTDGINAFENAQVMISRKEHDDVYRYRSLHFSFPAYWSKRLKMNVIDYVPERIGSFDQSFPLTKAGDVRIVPTPGHTLGHQSVLLQDEGLTYFFGGDSSFDLLSLMNDIIDAPAFDANRTRETRQKILDYALDTPTIYMTTHDLETGRRLQQRIPLYEDKHFPTRREQQARERATRVLERRL